MFIGLFLTILAIAGTLITSTQAVLTLLFRRPRRPFAPAPAARGFQPADSMISILKPVCGLDDDLERNLDSFVGMRGIQYEVILSVEEQSDPAMPVVTTAVRDHPDVFRLVVGGGSRQPVVNRKVDRLAAAARVARGSILFISDSNVRVDPDALRDTVAELAGGRIGCVSNLFVGSGARDLGARLESLHLLSFVVPGNVIAAAAHVPCVVGKSMALTRTALEAIGGFERFRRVLAEDQAIGVALQRAGFGLKLSPVLVKNVIERRTVKRALDRQIRWNKIRYAFSKPLYAFEILLNPVMLAAAAVLLGAPVLLLAAVIAARFAAVVVLRQATQADAPLWAVPLLDTLSLYAWIVPFFSNRVAWRGYEVRIGKGTELLARAA